MVSTTPGGVHGSLPAPPKAVILAHHVPRLKVPKGPGALCLQGSHVCKDYAEEASIQLCGLGF